jgi:hypothetical protein
VDPQLEPAGAYASNKVTLDVPGEIKLNYTSPDVNEHSIALHNANAVKISTGCLNTYHCVPVPDRQRSRQASLATYVYTS